MFSIFFISNDPRAVRLIEHFQPRLGSMIRWADNFDQGLQEVFEKRPSLVLIQNSINGVSGETVARHIKSLLGSGSPIIVYMDESGSRTRKNAAWCDEWLRLDDNDPELREEFARLVARLFPGGWKDALNSNGAASGPENGAGRDSRLQDEGGAGLETGGSVPPDGSSGDFDLGDGRLPPTENGADGDPGSADKAAIREFLNLYDLKGDAVNGASAAGTGRSGRRRLLALVCLLAVAIGAGLFLMSGRDTGSKASAPVASRPAASELQGVRKARVPSPRAGTPVFIRPEWLEPTFAKQHPGWERYLSPGLDFRIFREGGLIKALQVIAREGQPLSDAYLVNLLRDLGYAGPVKAGHAEIREGFLLEKADLGGFADLEICRENPGRAMLAIVLVFP